MNVFVVKRIIFQTPSGISDGFDPLSGLQNFQTLNPQRGHRDDVLYPVETVASIEYGTTMGHEFHHIEKGTKGGQKGQ